MNLKLLTVLCLLLAVALIDAAPKGQRKQGRKAKGGDAKPDNAVEKVKKEGNDDKKSGCPKGEAGKECRIAKRKAARKANGGDAKPDNAVEKVEKPKRGERKPNNGNGQVEKPKRGGLKAKFNNLRKSCRAELKENGNQGCPNSICQAFSVKDKACEKGKTAFADCMKKKKGKNVRRNRARCMKHIVRKGAMMKLRQMKQKRRNGSGKK